jgi:hypothetical protein
MDANPSKQETHEKIEEIKTSNQEDEVPNQEEGNPEIVTSGKQVKGQVEIPSKGVGDILFLTLGEPTTYATLKQSFKEIDSRIASITPLQFTKGNPDA